MAGTPAAGLPKINDHIRVDLPNIFLLELTCLIIILIS